MQVYDIIGDATNKSLTSLTDTQLSKSLGSSLKIKL